MAKIDNRKDVLLLLLFAAGKAGEREPIAGRTRFMKLLYLLKRQEKIEQVLKLKDFYKFEAYNYGPYSSQLYDDLEFLENIGFIEINTTGLASPAEQVEEEKVAEELVEGQGFDDLLVYEQNVFELTKKGEGFVRNELLPFVPPDVLAKLVSIKTDFGSIPLTSLLRYVYLKYPDSAENSKLQHLRG